MANTWREMMGKREAPMFVDYKHLLPVFEEWLLAPKLLKQIVIIYGVGGSGKSSYLSEFERTSRAKNIPTTYSNDYARSSIDVLRSWSAGLANRKIIFLKFQKTLEHYDEIRFRVDKESENNNEAVLRELSKQELKLFLDPTRILTKAFLGDLSKAAQKTRIVLMLDNYENLEMLDEWSVNLSKAISSNIILVISGRKLPNWKPYWNNWEQHAYIQDLAGMSDEDAIHLYELYSQYYGISQNPKAKAAILAFSGNLPLTIALASSFYTGDDADSIKQTRDSIVHEAVKRFTSQIPKEMTRILQATLIMRRVDKELLQKLTNLADFDALFNSLMNYSFITRKEHGGVEIHKTVKEFLEKDLQNRDIDTYIELHKRAAAYFEIKAIRAAVDKKWDLMLEALYHHVHADEIKGIQFCEEVAEDAVRYRKLDRLKTLLNEANNYPLHNEHSLLWRNYFNFRLIQLESKLNDANWLGEILADDAEPAIGDFMKDKIDYDVFISHAHEDKPFARDLANALKKRRLRVWYDEFTLSVGDRLRRSIDYGLANSKYGVVILSPYFFAKEWPQKELDGLVGRETTESKVLLPIWHNITAEEVRKYSPTLADRIAVTSDKGMEKVVTELLRAIRQ